jgi:hypothetical protein
MKRILNLITMLTFALLLMGGFSFAQNKQQNKSSQSMSKENTTQTDTNYAKSMAYYRFADKHIIQDSTKDKTYKGKWHNQNNPNMSSNGMKGNTNMSSSGKNMMNPNNTMMNNSKHKMSHHKMMGDSTHWKKKN